MESCVYKARNLYNNNKASTQESALWAPLKVDFGWHPESATEVYHIKSPPPPHPPPPTPPPPPPTPPTPHPPTPTSHLSSGDQGDQVDKAWGGVVLLLTCGLLIPGGGCEFASITICRFTWDKFIALLPILNSRSLHITFEGRFIESCVMLTPTIIPWWWWWWWWCWEVSSLSGLIIVLRTFYLNTYWRLNRSFQTGFIYQNVLSWWVYYLFGTNTMS